MHPRAFSPGDRGYICTRLVPVVEKIGWFAILYACVSCTVTLLMLVLAGKALKVGGPVGMVRCISLLVLAFIGFVVWVAKSAAGVKQGTANEEIKRTIKATSTWLNSLKDEWDKGRGPGDSNKEGTQGR